MCAKCNCASCSEDQSKNSELIALLQELELENFEFQSELGEMTGDETAQASAAASRRAAKNSYEKFRSDCKGVDLLLRLTKDSSNPILKRERLETRVKQIPEIFKKIQLEEEKLKTALQNTPSVADRDKLRSQHRITVAKLQQQAGFDPRVVLTEKTALAQAQCELSQFIWREYSLCNGKEVDDPSRFSIAVAQHYAKTELNISAAGQIKKCEINSVFCDVQFSNGIVIRVNFTNIPDYFTATQVAPRSGAQREYRYTCFRGQINFTPNREVQSPGNWPHERTFSGPPAGLIPAKYSLTTLTVLDEDLMGLEIAVAEFNRSIEVLENLVKQQPRPQALFDETAKRVQRQQTTVKTSLEKLIRLTKTGWYRSQGIAKKDFAKAAAKVKNLGGKWLRKPPIKLIMALRQKLLNALSGEVTKPLQREFEQLEIAGKTTKKRMVDPAKVSCANYNPKFPIFKAIGTNDPVGVLESASQRAVAMLGAAIVELQSIQKRVIAGEPPAWPVISDHIGWSLENRMRMKVSDPKTWTGKGPRTASQAIRWLSNIRKIIAGRSLRFTCLDPAKDCGSTRTEQCCGPNTWALAIPGRYRIYLCRRFWNPKSGVDAKTHAEFQAQTIIHEASHIYYSTVDEGRGQGRAECISQFVADVSGSPLDADYISQCGGQGLTVPQREFV